MKTETIQLKKYYVLLVPSKSDFRKYEVQATSVREAKKKALKKYHSNDQFISNSPFLAPFIDVYETKIERSRAIRLNFF